MHMKRLISPCSLNDGYYRQHGVHAQDSSQAAWAAELLILNQNVWTARTNEQPSASE